MKTDFYNQQGEKIGVADLPLNFNLPWNPNMVWSALKTFMTSRRSHYAHAKGRGEVRGGGRKPWQQKGLGKARHGSSRSPIWKGGGVSHGPTKEKNFFRKINKKIKRKTLAALFSAKLKDNEILFLDDIKIEKGKTREAKNILENLKKIKGFENLAGKGGKAALFLSKENKKERFAFKNLPNLETKEISNLNILDLANFKYLIIPKKEIEKIKL